MHYEEWEDSVSVEITNDSFMEARGLSFGAVCCGCRVA